MKNQKRQRKKSKARRFFCFLVFLILLPVFLWAGLNLLFSYSWGANLVAKQVGKKLGFPCEIDRLSWTPWSGGHANGFRILVPVNVGPGGEAALVSVKDARVWPSWSDLRRGKLDFTSINVDGVDVTLGIETLKDLSAGRLRGISTLPPEQKAVSAPPAPQPDPTPPEASKNPNPPKGNQAAPAPAESPVKPAEPEKIPANHFIHVTRLNLRVLGKSKETLLALENLALDLPLGGSDTKGHVLFSALKIAGQPVMKNENIPLHCEGRKIMLDLKRTIFGITGRMQALVSLQNGLPLFMDIDLPKQSASFENLPFGFPAIKVAEMQQRHVFQGLALHPTSWMANSLGVYRKITAHDPEDGSEFIFDRGKHVAILQGGVLNVPDFRFIGEEDSVLGNGKILLDGRLQAVIRLVTSDEHGQEHRDRVKGMSQARNTDIQLLFEPLSVPERVFHDLHLEGELSNPMVDMGTDKKDVPLIKVLETLFFIDLSSINKTKK